MDIDIDSYAALAQSDEDIEVELDERDFQDPNLLVKITLRMFILSQNLILILLFYRMNFLHFQT